MSGGFGLLTVQAGMVLVMPPNRLVKMTGLLECFRSCVWVCDSYGGYSVFPFHFFVSDLNLHKILYLC